MLYRKKPVIIEAVQLGESKEEIAELARFCPSLGILPSFFQVKTLEGTMEGNVGDWLIRGIAGEFYFCKPDIFEATYELVDELTEPEARALMVESITRHMR